MTRSPAPGDQAAKPPTAPGDTVVALSSGRPPAAIAVIRTSGPGAFGLLEALTGRPPPQARRAVLRHLADPLDGAPIDQALVLLFPAPNSATGEDIVEYQCHGGRAVVERLLSFMVARPGVRLAEPGEFTRRALARGRIDLTEAEGLADLIEAETEAQRKAALKMSEGGLTRLIADWRGRVIGLSARAEAAIDYVGDEDETRLDEQALVTEAIAIAGEMQRWLERPRAEPLKEGIRVVAAGPPNAGKSSLINVLAGSERAIVTDIPGTTRDVIEIPIAIEGLPLVLVDTAGLRESDDAVERIGIGRAEQEAARADVLLWLGAPDRAPRIPNVIRLFPRADQPGRGRPPEGTLGVSSVSGEGIEPLWRTILELARQRLPAPGDIALNQRQAGHIRCAAEALTRTSPEDAALLAADLLAAKSALDRVIGASGIDEVLDALFSRFCLGK